MHTIPNWNNLSYPIKGRNNKGVLLGLIKEHRKLNLFIG